MKTTRRRFIIQGAAGSGMLAAGLGSCTQNDKVMKNEGIDEETFTLLDKMLERRVLKREWFPDALPIETLELLRFKGNFICRVRAAGGAEGISVANNSQMASLYPIFTNRLQPYFIGKDARDLEDLLDGVYVYRSNYKLQGLPLWVPQATIEFAILDMLGKVAGKSMGELIGDIHNPRVSVYRANNYRGRTAEESIEFIRQNVEETGARAVKFKVGGRMSRDMEDPPGRTEKLIPLVRETFGDDMVIYADSNGSYSVKEAVRIGRIMEANRFDLYEEPVPFDWYEETRQVAEALEVPVAGGEQEPSLHNFRWLVGSDGLDIVQPDMFYFGGMIRSVKAARMAEARDKLCVPHISGSGLGYLYMMHFISAIPNAGPFHEFKGFNRDIPFECQTSGLESDAGVVTVPTGPGLGIQIDPDFLEKHKLVRD